MDIITLQKIINWIIFISIGLIGLIVAHRMAKEKTKRSIEDNLIREKQREK